MHSPRVLLLVLAALIAAAVAGCGSSSDDAGSAATATTSAADSAFPVTVEHALGTTTVPHEPRRIVVVGVTEQDVVLQLGFTPIATTEWYGSRPSAVWPWARAALGDAKPTVLSTADGFQFERIAALKPDLIIGTNAGLERGDYEKLSRIAPTIAGVKGDSGYFGAWDRQTVLIAKALGREEAGRRLVADVKAQYAEAAAAHPEWQGKIATFAQNGFYSGLLYVYPDGLNTEFLTYLGFTINPKLTPLVKKLGEQVTVSPERLDVIDADVIVFATEKPSDITELRKVPTFEKLGAVAGHRAVYTDGTLAGALYFMTPLSLTYALKRLVPQLEDAVAGRAPQRMLDTTDDA